MVVIGNPPPAVGVRGCTRWSNLAAVVTSAEQLGPFGLGTSVTNGLSAGDFGKATSTTEITAIPFRSALLATHRGVVG
jgi:hypothetical protein